MAKKGKNQGNNNKYSSVYEFIRGLDQMKPESILSKEILAQLKTHDASGIAQQRRREFTPDLFCMVVDSLTEPLLSNRRYASPDGPDGIKAHALDAAYFAGGDRFGDEVLRIFKPGY